MFKLIKQLFNLLTPSQRKRFFALQFLVVFMALIELVSIASILPFMALVGDMTLIKQDTYIGHFYQASGMSSETEFIFLLGVGALVILFISAIISMFTIWKLSMLANKIGTEIADRLYAYYLKQNWLFHAGESSAKLTKNISTETSRTTQGILVPLMQINARLVVVLFISFSIFIYDPKVALIGLVIFLIAYFFLYKIVRIRLERNSKAISDMNEHRFRLKNEGFGGIKDILLLGRDADLIKQFNHTGQMLAYSLGMNSVLAHAPRYFMELVAFGSMILLVLYLIASHDGNLGMILPVLSVYTLAAFKILPSFQHIYANVAIIKGNTSAFESIKKDLRRSFKKELVTEEHKKDYLPLKKQIELENISFTYPDKKQATLNQLSMSIQANSLVGVVGSSGAGKSTLIDILLGLIVPQNGNLKVDSEIISSKNRRTWQNTIGFVAQSIFLSDGTIAENVAFGINKSKIEYDKVNEAIKLAHLFEFTESLNKGIHTLVGERGVQLSGGQRQRIGIARALYHQAELLVFDEATSSLDGITEKMIMDSINNLSGQKTIVIIAHRLKTIEKCDQIFFIDEGKIIDQGTYEKLIESNERFKSMAAHA